MGGHIKLNRKILEWGWYHDINTCRLFIHMLLKANWKDGYFRDQIIPRGSFVSSIAKLSEETNLTEREVRTAIFHLETTGEITKKATNKYSVFTLCNYAVYQTLEPIERQATDIQPTSNRHSNDILTTTIEERKKGRREEGNNSIISNEIICPTETVERVVEAWNSLSDVGLEPVQRLSRTSKRGKNLVARIREYGEEKVLDAIGNIRESAFLLGANDRSWTIDFEWFVKPNNFIKVLENKYKNRAVKDNVRQFKRSTFFEEGSQ